MISLSATKAILRADGLRLIRDRFLVAMAVLSVGMSFVLARLLPWAGREVRARLAFELEPYFPLIVSHFVVQLSPFLSGVVGGFLLLDARESRTLRALLVSPVPLGAYLGVLAAVTVSCSVMLSVLQSVIISVGAPAGPGLLASVLAGALAAPVLTMAIAIFAENKTEAFAYMKIFGLGPLAASASYFLPEPWQWLAAVYPPYSASKAYWVAEAGGDTWPAWALAGVLASFVWLYVLLVAFRRVARR